MLMYSKKDQKGVQQSASGFDEPQKNILASSKYSSKNEVPPSMRERFEGRYGFDLSGVKVHSDASERFGAIAYTQGADIYMSKSADAIKDRILSHELMHVVQQAQGKVVPDFGILNVNPMMELSADSGARETMNYAGGVVGTLAPLPTFSSAAPIQCAKKNISRSSNQSLLSPSSLSAAVATNSTLGSVAPKPRKVGFFKRRRLESENEMRNNQAYREKLAVLKDTYSLELGTGDMPAVTGAQGPIPDTIGGLKGSHGERFDRALDIMDTGIGISDISVGIASGLSDTAGGILNSNATQSASNILGGIGSAVSLLGGVAGTAGALIDIVKNGKEADAEERAGMGLGLASSLVSIGTGAVGLASLTQTLAPAVLPGLGILSGALDIASGTMNAISASKKQKTLEELAENLKVSTLYNKDKGIMGESNIKDQHNARLGNIAMYSAYSAKGEKVKGITDAISGGLSIASGALSLTGVGAIAAVGTSIAAAATKGIGGGVSKYYDRKGRKEAIRNMEGTKNLSRKELRAHERIMKKETKMSEKERFDAMRIKDAMYLYNTGTNRAAGMSQNSSDESAQLIRALGLDPTKIDIEPKDIAESLGISHRKWKKMIKKHNANLSAI